MIADRRQHGCRFEHKKGHGSPIEQEWDSPCLGGQAQNPVEECTVLPQRCTGPTPPVLHTQQLWPVETTQCLAVNPGNPAMAGTSCKEEAMVWRWQEMTRHLPCKAWQM